MNEHEAARILGDALARAHAGSLEWMRRMAQPGVVFPLTRWERWRIRVWARLGRTWRVQRIILGSLNRANRQSAD